MYILGSLPRKRAVHFFNLTECAATATATHDGQARNRRAHDPHPSVPSQLHATTGPTSVLNRCRAPVSRRVDPQANLRRRAARARTHMPAEGFVHSCWIH